jgi:hypothetical protein
LFLLGWLGLVTIPAAGIALAAGLIVAIVLLHS